MGQQLAAHRRGLLESGTWEWLNVVALVVETWRVDQREPHVACPEGGLAWVQVGVLLPRS